MRPQIHPDVFIQTLTQLWDEDCQRKKAKLRLQLKDSVKRFVEEFHAGTGKGRHRTVRHPRTALSTLRQVRGG